MSYSLRLRKFAKEKIDAAVSSATDLLGLRPLVDRRPKALSGGQRQRVAMGRAIVREPQAFLWDEPLSNLDARLREQMRAEIKKLHQRLGATSIYVTHDQIEAMTLADRIVAMDGGHIQQIGSPLDLYERPANLFVAGFIGSPAMNFFEGRYRRAGDAAFLDLDAGASIAIPACPVADGFDLTIGIRPEHVLVGEAARPGAPVCPVELVEPTGVGAILHVRFGEAPLKAFHLGRTALRSGESVAVSLPPEKLLLFDTKTGRRLDD